MHLQGTRIGLGYVGLPLSVEFGKHYPTIGFDLKAARVAELRAGLDRTRETTMDDLRAATHLTYTTDPADLAACNVYIVTVSILERASGLTHATEAAPPVGAEPSRRRTEALGLDHAPTATTRTVACTHSASPGGPGTYDTEEICVPIPERESGLTHATEPAPPALNPSPTGRGQGEGQTQDFFHPADHSPLATSSWAPPSASTPATICAIEDEHLRVLVVTLGHRRDVYR